MHSLAMIYAGLLATAAVGTDSVRIPQVPFEKYTLSNGLQVILHEDHSLPIVGVNLWYHVGSKDERPGRTGFAHLFEHMMFQGSKHHDADFFGPLQKAGGRLNGSTSTDRTNYWENIPSAYLELALWLEADRMGFLLPAMTPQRLDNQRDVVKNERRQSYENRPYGLAEETILAAMYPPDHPYSWPVIGSMADITAASLEDVSGFFRRYYHPGNASLCIAGDFDRAQTKQWVAKYFGPLPAGPKVEKLKAWVPELKQPQRVRMEDRVGLPRLYLSWHTVPLFAADDAELEILGDVLGSGRTSRLYRRLVREKQIAQEVFAYHNSQEISGRFNVVVTARPGHTLAELEAAVDEELGRLTTEPPTPEEIEQATSGREADLVKALEYVGGFGGRADRLNMYNTLTGDPGFLTKDYQRYLKVDAPGVLRVARKYLAAPRMVLEITPAEKTSITPDPRQTAAKAREELARNTDAVAPKAPAVTDAFDRSLMPKPGPEKGFIAPPVQRRRLPIGMDVLAIEKRDMPLVYLRAVFRVGRSADPATKLGLAEMMAAVWDEGTERRSANDIAEELARIGADLSISTTWDSTSVGLSSLRRHLGRALEVYSDVLQHPVFAAAELQRQRASRLARLVQVRNEPTALAGMAVNASLYGQDHPYGRPQFGTPGTLQAITPEDLKEFYRTRIRPEHGTLIAVGDVTADEIVAELEKVLAGWKPSGPAAAEQPVPPPPAPQPTRLLLVDKPGAAQSVIDLGLAGFNRMSPDYFPLVVMNTVLGGQFSSRLNMNLREEKGYTYGARTYLDWRVQQPGVYLGSASVQTAVTAPALTEFLKEYRGMTGARPLGAEELEFCRTYLARGFPAEFETSAQLAQQLDTLVQYRLPDNYFQTVVPGIRAVTAEDVLCVARKYVNMEHLAVVVVGDRSAVEADLRKLPIGKNLAVYRFDEEFRLVPAP